MSRSGTGVLWIVGVGVLAAVGVSVLDQALRRSRAAAAPAPAPASLKPVPLADCVRWGSTTTSAPWASIDAATVAEVEAWRARAAVNGRQTTPPKCGGAYGAFT